MQFDWDEEKNEKLKKERNISFERIIISIESGNLLDVLEHPNQKIHSGQILIILKIDDYAWVVPSVLEKDVFYLKTAFPSRKYTQIYLPEARK